MGNDFVVEELILSWVDGKKWVVLKEFDWTDDKHPERHVVVPPGFVTDFASIPRVLWVALPPTGKYGKAAVIHDYLYQRGTWADGRPCTRGEADGSLNQAMKDLGVRWSQRWVIQAGIRSGGWVAWNKYRKADQAGQESDDV